MHTYPTFMLRFTHKTHCKNRRANSEPNSGPNDYSFIVQLLIVDFEIKHSNICYFPAADSMFT